MVNALRSHLVLKNIKKSGVDISVSEQPILHDARWHTDSRGKIRSFSSTEYSAALTRFFPVFNLCQVSLPYIAICSKDMLFETDI